MTAIPQDYDWAKETREAARALLEHLTPHPPTSIDVSSLVKLLGDLRLRYVPDMVRFELDGWDALYADGQLWQAG